MNECPVPGALFDYPHCDSYGFCTLANPQWDCDDYSFYTVEEEDETEDDW